MFREKISYMASETGYQSPKSPEDADMIWLKNFRFQMKINFLNTILIAYLNTCTSVLIDKMCIFSDSKKVLDQNNSVDSGD